MSDIHAQFTVMKKNAEQLHNLNVRLATELRNINYLASKLDIFWDGDANAEYNRRIVEDIAYMAGCCESAGVMIGVINKALGRYTLAEDTVAMILKTT